MAVTFRKGPKTLLNDLQKRGYKVASVQNAAGNPARSIQIYLKNGLVINWDRDSRSVWAEGPWPQAQKAEAYLKKIYEGNWLRRMLARNRTAIFVTILLVTIALISSRVFAPHSSAGENSPSSGRPPGMADDGGAPP